MSYGYYDGRFMVIVHVSLGRVDGEPRDFCAVFQALPVEVHDRETTSRGKVEAKFPSSDLGYDYIEQSVLVKIVEVAEQGQQRTTREGSLCAIYCTAAFPRSLLAFWDSKT
jgi:hypothetical protein